MSASTTTSMSRAALGWLVAAALSCTSGAVIAQSGWRVQILDPYVDITPVDINDRRQVLGHLINAHAAIKYGADIVDLGRGEPAAINARGIAVGNLFAESTRAVKWTARGPAVLSDAGDASAAYGVNRRGETVGVTYVATSFFATHWFRGKTTYLGQGYANAINNVGGVAGIFSTSPATPPRAATWQDGTMTLLGGPVSYALAINDAGLVVGNEGNSARLWRDGTTVVLSMPAGTTSATGINQAGDIVGHYSDGIEERAILWRDDGGGYDAIDINSMLRPGAPEAGWVLRRALRINNRGDIVGTALNRSCEGVIPCVAYGFILTRSALPDEYPIPLR